MGHGLTFSASSSGTGFAPSHPHGLHWVPHSLPIPGASEPPPAHPGCHSATPGATVPKVPMPGCPAGGTQYSPKPSARSRLPLTCTDGRRGTSAQTCHLLELRWAWGKEGEQEAGDVSHSHAGTCEGLGRDMMAQGG